MAKRKSTCKRHPFGQRLDSLRRDMGMTQENFSRYLGFTTSAISKWCQGRREPSLESIRRIAKKLKVPLSQLIEADDKAIVPPQTDNDI